MLSGYLAGKKTYGLAALGIALAAIALYAGKISSAWLAGVLLTSGLATTNRHAITTELRKATMKLLEQLIPILRDQLIPLIQQLVQAELARIASEETVDLAPAAPPAPADRVAAEVHHLDLPALQDPPRSEK